MNDPTIISVEGIDGAGKSTLMENLEDHFGDDFHYSKEPTDYWTGQAVENCKGSYPNATFFAFQMDRAFHIGELPEDKPVIVDRYIHSTIAYQQELLDIDGNELQYIYNVLSIFPHPDVILYLDITPEMSIRRTGDEEDMYEEVSFLRKVRNNYENALTADKCCVPIDGGLTEEQVSEKAIQALKPYVA